MMQQYNIEVYSGDAEAAPVAPKKNRMRTPFSLLFLSAVCGMIVYAYSDALRAPGSSGASMALVGEGTGVRRALAMDDEEYKKRVSEHGVLQAFCASCFLDIKNRNLVDHRASSSPVHSRSWRRRRSSSTSAERFT